MKYTSLHSYQYDYSFIIFIFIHASFVMYISPLGRGDSLIKKELGFSSYLFGVKKCWSGTSWGVQHQKVHSSGLRDNFSGIEPKIYDSVFF